MNVQGDRANNIFAYKPYSYISLKIQRHTNLAMTFSLYRHMPLPSVTSGCRNKERLPGTAIKAVRTLAPESGGDRQILNNRTESWGTD